MDQPQFCKIVNMNKILLICFLVLISCSKEDPKESESEEFFFEIDKKTLNSNYVGKEIDLAIITNTNWELNSKPEWVSASVNNGKGNSEITVSILENPDGEPRNGELVFDYSNKKYRLDINQEGATLKLISFSGFEAPIKMHEPKYLLFNKPVTLNYIMSGDELYSFLVKDNEVEYFNGRRGIKFTTGPSFLGSDHNYKFSVKDDDNQKLEDIVNFRFYSQKMDFSGEIRKIIVDNENDL